MTITYEPKKILKRIVSKKRLKKLVTQNLTLNKAALSFANDVGVISKKEITTVALKAIKTYKNNYKTKDVSRKDAVADKKLLVQRVQNSMVHQISEGIREKYDGEFYEWLESTANEQDEDHKLNYGKIFRIGDGEMPGERFGCQCGMRILVDDKRLSL